MGVVGTVVPVVCSGAVVSASVGAGAVGAMAVISVVVMPDVVVAVVGASVRGLSGAGCVVPLSGTAVVPEGAHSAVVAAGDAAADSSGRLTSAPVQAGNSSSNAAAHTAPARRCIRSIIFHPLLL